MKELYTAPKATVITLEAVEKLALLDAQSEGGDVDIGDIGISNSTGSGRPK